MFNIFFFILSRFMHSLLLLFCMWWLFLSWGIFVVISNKLVLDFIYIYSNMKQFAIVSFLSRLCLKINLELGMFFRTIRSPRFGVKSFEKLNDIGRSKGRQFAFTEFDAYEWTVKDMISSRIFLAVSLHVTDSITD